MYANHATTSVPGPQIRQRQEAWRVLKGPARQVSSPRTAGLPRRWVAASLLLLAAVLALYVHTVGYESQLHQRRQAIRRLKQESTLLRSELASLQNPREVEHLAVDRLAMRLPGEVVYLPGAGPGGHDRAVRQAPRPRALVHEGY